MHPSVLVLSWPRLGGVAAAAALLVGCGGSSTNAPFSLAGVAHVGTPLAGKVVSARCAVGTLSTTTAANGAFTLAFNDHKLPCMLEVDTGTAVGKLHAAAAGAGSVNLTPLTELAMARALRASPAATFTAIKSDGALSVPDTAAAGSAVAAEANRLMGWTITADPMTMAIGTDEARALDNLLGSLANAGSSLPKLAEAAAAGTALLAALPAEESRPHDSAPYAVREADAAATTFAALPVATGDAIDVTATQRLAGRLASYDANAKSPFSAYRIEVPPNWNGELVMYAHGYAGEGATLNGTDAAIRRHLVNNGYAWAASSYSKNSYDVRAGVEDTNKLALAFASLTGRAAPSRTWIIGHSMGGHVAAAAVEEETLATAQNKVRYAGSVPMCAVMGDAELFNTIAAEGLAAQTLSGLGAALPAALTARQRYQMLLAPAQNPQSILQPVHDALFSNFPNTGFTPKAGAGQQYASVLRNLTGGNRPMFDIGLSYGGSYVGGPYRFFGVDGILTGMLTRYSLDTRGIRYVIDGDATASAALNAAAPRLAPDANVNPLRRDGLRWVPQVNGQPYAPVLTIHTLGDLFVPFSMQQIYRQRVTAAGPARADRVVQRAIRGASHCDFTNAEMAQAFDDMVKWAKAGARPAGDDVLTAATVAAPTYGCAFTRNTFHPVDEATGGTRTLRGLIAQLGQSCPAN